MLDRQKCLPERQKCLSVRQKCLPGFAWQAKVPVSEIGFVDALFASLGTQQFNLLAEIYLFSSFDLKHKVNLKHK